MTEREKLPPVVTVSRFAAEVELDSRTVRRLIKDGTLPALDLEPEYRLLRECVDVLSGGLTREEITQNVPGAFKGTGTTLKTSEVAELLQTTENTIRKKGRNGVIRANKAGHQWRFNRDALLRGLTTPADC